MLKMRLRPGLRTGPRWGSHDTPPDPLVGWGGGWRGGYPLPTSHPLGGCSASALAPLVLASRRPPLFFDKSNRTLELIRIWRWWPMCCRLGRRRSLIVYYAIAGVALILSQLIPEQAGKSDNLFTVELHRSEWFQLLNACGNFKVLGILATFFVVEFCTADNLCEISEFRVPISTIPVPAFPFPVATAMQFPFTPASQSDQLTWVY